MNPYSNIRKVLKVTYVLEWEVEGEWFIDHMIPSFINYVIAEDDNGEKWVHQNVFPNDSESAQKLCKRVNEAGFINLKYWGFHEFFSLSYEERMQAECEREEEEREAEYQEDRMTW